MIPRGSEVAGLKAELVEADSLNSELLTLLKEERKRIKDALRFADAKLTHILDRWNAGTFGLRPDVDRARESIRAVMAALEGRKS